MLRLLTGLVTRFSLPSTLYGSNSIPRLALPIHKVFIPPPPALVTLATAGPSSCEPTHTQTQECISYILNLNPYNPTLIDTDVVAEVSDLRTMNVFSGDSLLRVLGGPASVVFGLAQDIVELDR